jgi:tetratricopeptide (TPR) repeat protein
MTIKGRGFAMRRISAALAIVALTAAAAAAQTESNPLAAARDLYASARYDEALAVLNAMRPAESIDRKSIEQYRSLCLLALGRGTEAEGAIAAVVTADPLYQPSEAEASPRVRAAFTEVRQRLLPDIVSVRYAEAKASFDRKEFALAEQQFQQVMSLLDDPQMNGRLPDLRVLVSGFLDLSARAAAPPPEPKPAAPLPAAPAPSVAPIPGRIYVAEDEGVTIAVPIRQEVPRVPQNITSQARDRGLLELIIDEQGRVVTVMLRMSVHPVYDAQLMAAARDWKYLPATVGGRPVKFRKMVQITVSKR